MEILNRETFDELANVHEPHCVSIYIPTHRAGHEGIKKDKITFKNQLQEVAQKLESYELTKDQISNYLRPARELLEDETLWSHLSEGMAVYLYGDEMKCFRVPVSFEARHHIENNLYLLPVIPLLTDAGRHFVLAISLNQVRFFEATRHSITPVDISALIPENLEDAVGADYEQQSLQFRSGQDVEPGRAIYHGHGSGEMPEKKEEARKYFDQVNDGLMRILNNEKAPLVLACVDYLYPIYREANSYANLEETFIHGNHDETRPEMLQEKSWEIVGDQFDHDREQEINDFDLKLSAANASFQAADVVPACMIGRAETLFVRKGTSIWGTYDPDVNRVKISDVRRTGQTELVNQAAVKTILHGGKVLYLDEADMPEEMDDIAATYRYSM